MTEVLELKHQIKTKLAKKSPQNQDLCIFMAAIGIQQ